MKSRLKKKGAAGLELYLAVIVSVFLIGMIVASLNLVMVKMKTTTIATERTPTLSVVNESHLMNGTIKYFDLDVQSLTSVLCSVGIIHNTTAGIIPSTNYTISNCRVTEVAGSKFENETWDVSYSYTYLVPNSVSDILNGTQNATGSSIDWFDIFITLAAAVSLVIMVVLIFRYVRASGLMGGGDGTA